MTAMLRVVSLSLFPFCTWSVLGIALSNPSAPFSSFRKRWGRKQRGGRFGERGGGGGDINQCCKEPSTAEEVAPM